MTFTNNLEWGPMTMKSISMLNVVPKMNWSIKNYKGVATEVLTVQFLYHLIWNLELFRYVHKHANSSDNIFPFTGISSFKCPNRWFTATGTTVTKDICDRAKDLYSLHHQLKEKLYF